MKPEEVKEGAIPSYLMDRENVNRTKVIQFFKNNIIFYIQFNNKLYK